MQHSFAFRSVLSRTAWLASFVILLLGAGACAPLPVHHEPKDNTAIGVEAGPSRQRPSAEDFVVDRRRDPETGADLGPLLSYQLSIESVLDPDDRPRLRQGRLVGESIVFGLPGTGDRGAAWKMAIERAAEMFAGTTREELVSEEKCGEGELAWVRLETPGFPSGQAAGTTLPVIVIPQGNCTGIVGGHIYECELACKQTGQVYAIHPYGVFEAEEVVSYDSYFSVPIARPNVAGLLDEHGNVIDPGRVEAWREASSTRPELKDRRFMLTEGFRLLRATGWEERGRDEILMTLVPQEHSRAQAEAGRPAAPALLRFESEIVAGVVKALRDRLVGARVFWDKSERRRVRVVPSILKGTLDEYYDRMRLMAFELFPVGALVIIADDRNGRLLLVGEPEQRRLVSNRNFTFGPDDIPFGPEREFQNPRLNNPTGNFRLTLQVGAGRQKLMVAWSRFENGSRVDGGEATIANDVGALMRLVYAHGCVPADCLFILMKLRRESFISAQIDMNPVPVGGR